VNVNADAVTSSFDLDVRNSGTIKTLGQKLTDANVFGYVVLVALTFFGRVGEPTRTVVGGDTESETVWVYFLTH
jgi:hypothetical protein